MTLLPNFWKALGEVYVNVVTPVHRSGLRQGWALPQTALVSTSASQLFVLADVLKC
jgi:hypothetical protein